MSMVVLVSMVGATPASAGTSTPWIGPDSGVHSTPPALTCRAGMLQGHTPHPSAGCEGRDWFEKYGLGSLMWLGPDWGQPPTGSSAAYSYAA